MNDSSPERITLSHGAGGQAMRELVEQVILCEFGARSAGDDSAIIDAGGGPFAFTTDSFVVDPIFFPGGDIGRLAVAGTVNDLLTAAARPVALSVSLIIEEGLEIETLRRIARSMRETADESGAAIVTGDTKVVPRGSADRVFVTTAGVGAVMRPGVSGSAVRPGDRLILTGTAADHGTAVMLAREDLLTGDAVASDTAPLVDIVVSLVESGCEVRAMRDPTRGGIASALNEIARQSGVCIRIEESAVCVKPPVAAACEALGLDPLQVANEGKMLVFVAAADAERALSVVRACRYGEEAGIIGEVTPEPIGRVTARTPFGTSRIVDMPSGELLPRIC